MSEIEKMNSTLLFDNFHQPFFNVCCSFRDGSQIQKTIKFSDYQRLIKSGIEEVKELYREVPSLPKYYYKGGITTENDTFWVSFFIPKSNHQMGFAATNEFLYVPYPNLFFLLEVKKGTVIKKCVYAVADDIPNDNSLLFLYPYGNVSAEGSICMGNCITKLENLSMSNTFVDAFFLGKDAGHYYQRGKWAKPDVPLRDLISLAEKKGVFPTEWLMPSISGQTQRTIGNVIEPFRKKLQK